MANIPATATEPGIFRWDDMDYIKKRIDEVKAKCRWCVIVSHGGVLLVLAALTGVDLHTELRRNATPILFGDFRRTYLIIDRMGVRVFAAA